MKEEFKRREEEGEREVDLIKLGMNDCAFVLRDGKIIEFHIPNLKDDDMVSDDIITVTTIAILLKQQDKDFCDFIGAKFKEYITELTDEPS